MPIMEIVLGLLGIILTGVGFYVRRLYSKMDQLEQDLVTHRVDDARSFITRMEMKEYADRIREDIKQLVLPLDNKLQSIEKFLRKQAD